MKIPSLESQPPKRWTSPLWKEYNLRMLRRLVPYAVCTGLILAAMFMPETRFNKAKADIPQIPLHQFTDLQEQFASLQRNHQDLSTQHRRTLDDLNMTKMLFLDMKGKLDREHRRRKFVEIMEEKGHTICFKHQYYLYDLVESLVLGYFINDPVVMEILNDPEHFRMEMNDPAALIVAMMDAESGLHSVKTSERYKRGGKWFYDVGLFQIQIPEWTAVATAASQSPLAADCAAARSNSSDFLT